MIKVLKNTCVSTCQNEMESIFFKFCVHVEFDVASNIFDESKCSNLKKMKILFAVLKDFLVNHHTPIDFTFYMATSLQESEEDCISKLLSLGMCAVREKIEKHCINTFLSIFNNIVETSYHQPKGNKYCCVLKNPENEIEYRKPCKANKREFYCPTLLYFCVRNAVCNECNCQQNIY